MEASAEAVATGPSFGIHGNSVIRFSVISGTCVILLGLEWSFCAIPSRYNSLWDLLLNTMLPVGRCALI